MHRKQKTPPKRGSKLVGERGFEPPTHWSQTSCATKLRYSPKYYFFEFLVQFFKVVVRGGGLEPPTSVRTLTPEASASTNSATFALSQLLIMGWLMGFEPTTTGITIQGSTN